MRVITFEEAREQGITSAQIWATAQWNAAKSMAKETPRQDRARLWEQAEALEQVAKELEVSEKMIWSKNQALQKMVFGPPNS
jgi:membrane-bound lytic murein transglycosylase B